MELTPNTALNFFAWNCAWTRGRFDPEVNKIRTCYHHCSDNLSDKQINEYLDTCSRAVIVINEDGKLRGFAFCDFINSKASFRVRIIKGDNFAIKLMMRYFRIESRSKYVKEFLITVDSEKISVFQEYGFKVCEENPILEDGRIEMYNEEKMRNFGPK